MPTTADLLASLPALRAAAGLSPEELESRLVLGPGWINKIETGEYVPHLNTLLAILSELGTTPADFFSLEGGDNEGAEVQRPISVSPLDRGGLRVHFRYARHDAEYDLPAATQEQFNAVVQVLRDGLARLARAGNDAEAVKTDAVAKTFLKATELWPAANPSDLWWFVVYRLYCDHFNHPAMFSRLDLGQSWKRTGGWALEEILVRHYAPRLAKSGVRLFIATGSEKIRLLDRLDGLADRMEADKADVLLTGVLRGEERCFGVVHVKASFAERRTDDVPMSRAGCDRHPLAAPPRRAVLGATDRATGQARPRLPFQPIDRASLAS